MVLTSALVVVGGMEQYGDRFGKPDCSTVVDNSEFLPQLTRFSV